jgi:hypothetical protein
MGNNEWGPGTGIIILLLFLIYFFGSVAVSWLLYRVSHHYQLEKWLDGQRPDT